MTYIKQQAAFAKEREDILIFYGDKRKIDGKTYYFVSGALKVEEVNSCLYPILFNQEDWKGINECARQFFPNFAVLGWALLCEGADLELKTRILETQEEFFGAEQPVFMEYIKSEKEEKVYLYHRGKMDPQNGHYIYYDKNERMQNYMIHENETVEKVEEESVDHAARQFRMVVQEKQEEKKRKRTNLLLYSTAITLALVVMLIGITLLGNYEKMENMEKFLHEMAEDTTQKDYPVNTMEDSLNAMEVNGSGTEMVMDSKEGSQQAKATDRADVSLQQEEKSQQHVVNSVTQENDTQTQPKDSTGEIQTQEITSPEADSQEGNSEETQSQEITSPEADSQEGNSEETQTQEITSPEADSQEGNSEGTQPQPSTNQETNEQTEEKETYQTYIIKKGDTLEKINRLFYGNKNRINEICELNQIENQDNICYGEKIILPY